MRVLIASILASICGLAGFWLLEYRHRLQLWAGLESDYDIKAGGSE